MKKILLFFLINVSIFANANNFEKDLEENKNIQKIVLENTINNIGTSEEYYLKNNKFVYIVTKSISKEKNYIKSEKKKYYFDDNQNLIKYETSEEKLYENENISNDVKQKANSLKANINTNNKTKESKKVDNKNISNIETKINKEMDRVEEEINKQIDNIKKEMDGFFKNF